MPLARFDRRETFDDKVWQEGQEHNQARFSAFSKEISHDFLPDFSCASHGLRLEEGLLLTSERLCGLLQLGYVS
ncbi:hypothetical protein SAMN06298226_3050 [Nitrosovibrio sp. Nv4]|nr:hypothetical protein SAMN06298226_3050 [Nitrosovibrio sp. Nv4]